MQNTCTLCGHCFHLPTELERKFKENSRLSVGAAARQSRSGEFSMPIARSVFQARSGEFSMPGI
ncbi:hypothetical protein QUB60_03805 [Microcoleus sp. A2-C5]